MEDTSFHTRAEREFLKAYDAHADGLFRFLCLKIADRETARDLMQETFTRVWDYRAKGGIIQEWKPFLFRTAYNLVVDTYRKKRSVSLDALIDDKGFAVPDDSDLVNVRKAEVARVRKAINALEEPYRDVLLLRYIEDLPPREIARITGLSENVVSVRLHRATAKLRTIVDPQNHE